MNRMTPFVLVSLVLVGLSGCTTPVIDANVVTASYPTSYLVERLAPEELIHIELGTNAGLHDYSPNTRDIQQLRLTDLLVVWDEGLETWTRTVRDTLGASAPPILHLLEAPPGGALLEPDHQHHGDHSGESEEEHAAHADHGHAHGEAVDPHTWVDPLSYLEAAKHVATALIANHPEHNATIQGNLANLTNELEGLHEAYEDGLDDCTSRTISTNHNAYAYLAARYGFDVISLHSIEPGSEPSPQQVDSVIATIRNLELPTFFIEEGTNPSVVRAIQEETGVAIERLHTLESAPESGDYVQAQLDNLVLLRTAMGCE